MAEDDIARDHPDRRRAIEPHCADLRLHSVEALDVATRGDRRGVRAQRGERRLADLRFGYREPCAGEVGGRGEPSFHSAKHAHRSRQETHRGEPERVEAGAGIVEDRAVEDGFLEVVAVDEEWRVQGVVAVDVVARPSSRADEADIEGTGSHPLDDVVLDVRSRIAVSSRASRTRSSEAAATAWA